MGHVVTISKFKEGGRWYFELSAPFTTIAAAFLSVGVDDVTGTYGPFKSKEKRNEAAKSRAAYLRSLGVSVRWSE